MKTISFNGEFKIFKKSMNVTYVMKFCIFTHNLISITAVHQFISEN